jgi:hypothetical protein
MCALALSYRSIRSTWEPLCAGRIAFIRVRTWARALSMVG